MGESRTYTQGERDRIIAKIRADLEVGKRVKVSAAEQGISEGTFYRWVREKARGVEAQASQGYSPEEKAHILAAIRQRIGRGEGVEAAARATGITGSSYYNWTRLEKKSVPAMRPVALVPAPSLAVAITSPLALTPASPELTLSAPGGYRIEGLGIESAAALLRALA